MLHPPESSTQFTPAQQTSINAATDALGWVSRTAFQDEVKHLLSILQEDELLEKLLNVEYDGVDNCILAITDRRFMFVRGTFFRGINAKEYPLNHITSVEWKPGTFRHRVTVHIGAHADLLIGRKTVRGKPKKEEFYVLWRDGQSVAARTAVLLRAKILTQTAGAQPSSKEGHHGKEA